MMPRAAVLFQPTILLALALMAVIVMMILPMPAFVLDMGLAISFGLAILMFTVTLFWSTAVSAESRFSSSPVRWASKNPTSCRTTFA